MSQCCHLLFFSFIIFVSTFFCNRVDAGCAELNRCCPDKASSCKFEYGNGGGCYCDEFCRKSRDCCSDYEQHCMNRAQDCVMTYWTHWSHCTARCGKGTRERRREVHVPASNGGRECGHRRETRGCYHNDRRCRNNEIAQLLPIRMNRKRNEPDPWERPSELQKIKNRRNSYCINYRITSISWYCRYASPYHVLDVGSRVCAQCHDTAMNRRGKCQGATIGMNSRWRAMLGRLCYGSWTSLGDVVEDCTCDEIPGESYIFV